MMPGVPDRRTHDYIRAGTTTLFAALDVATGKVIAQLHRRHRAEEFRKFLNLIEHSRPGRPRGAPDPGQLPTHKTPAIRRWLLRHPRFHLHFTPTYARGSTWWNGGSPSSPRSGSGAAPTARPGARRLIRTWIERWNDQPRPSSGTRPPTRSWKAGCVL